MTSGWKWHSTLWLVFILLLFSCTDDKRQIEVQRLQCEYLDSPLGIDVINPRLSWQLKSSGYNVSQRGYRILVASERQKLDNDIGDLWDTDLVASDQSIHIRYEGQPLKSRQKVYWKAMVWDQDNDPTAWSEIASWEMGLLEKSDWEAKWIGRIDERTPVAGQRNPAIYFRKSVDLTKGIKNARAYISGLGYYELYINGKKVGDHVLSPNQTNYDHRQVNSYRDGQVANMSTRVLYETYDISDYLVQGENVFGVVLGNGWYYQTTREEYLPLFFDYPRFIGQMEINYTDGSQSIVKSDESWENAHGPILNNNLHHGEIYDARLEEDGWCNANFNDKGWETSGIVRAPEGKLKAQMSPPDRVVSFIKPKSFVKKSNGAYRYDFGTMLSGWVKLSVYGQRGDEIRLAFFEDTGNNFEQSDTYILKGDGLEIWEPRFTWHAFRYVEVSGATTELTMGSMEAKVVNTDVQSMGTFESSNDLFNTINEHFKKTQLGNMHGGVPSDCPHRERRGYTGDGQIAAQAAIYNFDIQAFYTKWLNDIADAQNKETGYVPNTVPYHSGGGGTPWGSAYIIIPWYMYLYYGDLSLVRAHYAGMKHYLDYLATQTDEQGLIVEQEIGEWVPPYKTEIPPSFVSSAYYYYDLTLMSKMAKTLGIASDAGEFSVLAQVVKKAFNQRYYQPESGNYSIGRQGANIFPLAFDLVSEDHVAKVFENLVQNVEVAKKGHFDTGMMGTPYLLEVLTKYGRSDLAYTVMNRRDFPSYGFNIERGATTLWETWLGNDSHSHPMFGSVCAWFFQGLGGINPDEQEPGFKHIIIKPAIVNELDFVKATYPSVYGEIKSDWELDNNDLKMDVVVPPNTTASVFIPGKNVNIVKGDNANVQHVGFRDGYTQYEVPSGEYSFLSKGLGEQLNSVMLSEPVIDPRKLTWFYPDTIEVSIRQYSKDAQTTYTLDGSEPDEHSSLYSNPIQLSRSTLVKAKTFRDGDPPGYSVGSKFVFIDSLGNGVGYSYYLGAWNRLPDYGTLKPVRKGRVYTIGLEEFEDPDNQFGIVFSGELKIDNGGKYTFYLNSNDGSRLYINNSLVVDTDKPNGFAGEFGEIQLSEGMHKIRLEYFQAGGGKGLDLEFEGPGVERQRLPADILFFDESK